MKNHLLFTIFAFLITFLLSSCGEHKSALISTPAAPVDIPLTFGAPHNLAITANANDAVADTVSGITFILPQGGSGTLTITPIATAPNLPRATGTGFRMEGMDNTPITLRFPKPVDGKELTVHAYLPAIGAYDGAPRPAMDWYLTLPTSTDDNYIYYALTRPASVAGIKRQLLSSGNKRTATATPEIYYPSISDPVLKRPIIEQKINDYINAMVNKLPAEGRAFVNLHRKNRPYSLDVQWNPKYNYYCFDGNTATLAFKPDIPDMIIAHEVGHYITHMLMSDAQYLNLQCITPETHEVGQLFSRASGINDDYAYYLTWMIDVEASGITGAMAPDPVSTFYIMLKGPKAADAPGREGFAAILMSWLTDKAISPMTDFDKTKSNIPLIKATPGEVAWVINSGAATINDLWTALQGIIGTNKKWSGTALGVVAERVGWSFTGRGKVTVNNMPTAGVAVNTEYNVWQTTDPLSTVPYAPTGTFSLGTGEYTIYRLPYGAIGLGFDYEGKHAESFGMHDLSTLTTTVIKYDDANIDNYNIVTLAPTQQIVLPYGWKGAVWPGAWTMNVSCDLKTSIPTSVVSDIVFPYGDIKTSRIIKLHVPPDTPFTLSLKCTLSGIISGFDGNAYYANNLNDIWYANNLEVNTTTGGYTQLSDYNFAKCPGTWLNLSNGYTFPEVTANIPANATQAVYYTINRDPLLLLPQPQPLGNFSYNTAPLVYIQFIRN